MLDTADLLVIHGQGLKYTIPRFSGTAISDVLAPSPNNLLSQPCLSELFILRYIYTYVFMYAHHIHSWYKKSEESIKSFGTRFIDNYEPLCGC